MSILSQLVLAEKYKGLRMDMAQLADELGREKGTLMNQVSNKTLGIRTYMDGGKRWADVRDVADYFDKMREQATA
jgi:hypothetical protein